jgi:hypothetical protein
MWSKNIWDEERGAGWRTVTVRLKPDTTYGNEPLIPNP